MAQYLASVVLYIFITITSFFIPQSSSIPFIVLHVTGIGDQCSNKGMKRFTKLLTQWSNSTGYCIEIGDGSWDSWFMPLEEQTEIVCGEGNERPPTRLQHYWSIPGQKLCLIGRATCWYSFSSSLWCMFCIYCCNCLIMVNRCIESRIMYIIADTLIKSEIYSDYIQEHLAPSGYLKLPNKQKCSFRVQWKKFLHGIKFTRFLPKLNNEIPGERNSTYKERFSSLQNLVLIMFEHDTVLVPKETSWFGYFLDGAFKPILAQQQTELYIEDWIGLKTLDDAGRVKYVKLPGNHLRISKPKMKKYIVPYLEDDTSKKDSIKTEVGLSASSAIKREMQNLMRPKDVTLAEVIIEASSSYSLPASIKSFLEELFGIR